MFKLSDKDQVQAARKAFGLRLRELRLDAGLNGRQLAAISGMRDSKISRIEHARQNPTEADIRAWCRACSALGQIPELIATHRQLDEMWEEHRRTLRAGLGQQSTRIKPLYEQTKLIRAYEPQTVPGFLQTRGYTRAVLEDVARFHELPDDLDEAVEGRMNRLRVLETGVCKFSFVVEAAALHAVRGNVAVMLEQLDFLMRAASFPNVALGIIPLGEHRTIWPGEGFYVYDETLVRSEHWTGGYRSKRPSEIATFVRIFGLLRNQAVYASGARSEIEAAGRYLQSRESS